MASEGNVIGWWTDRWRLEGRVIGWWADRWRIEGRVIGWWADRWRLRPVDVIGPLLECPRA